MALYTICYMVTGGIQIEAKNEDEAMEKFNSGKFDEEIGESLTTNELDVTEIYVEEDDEDYEEEE